MNLDDKLKAMLELIPEDHDLHGVLTDNLDSVQFAAPEMFDFWRNEIEANVRQFLAFPVAEWEKEISMIWSGNEETVEWTEMMAEESVTPQKPKRYSMDIKYAVQALKVLSDDRGTYRKKTAWAVIHQTLIDNNLIDPVECPSCNGKKTKVIAGGYHCLMCDLLWNDHQVVNGEFVG